MPLTYLLDTNIISHLMKEVESEHLKRYRARLQSEPDCTVVTSVVVQCELLFGLARHPSPRLQRAYDLQMEHLPTIALEPSVCAHYAKLRVFLEQAGTPIGANDTLIAAHALALDATLVSADAAFARVPGLRVENWFEAPPPPRS
jgi:tRNA(fMet)-specific endonuclease VapC